MSLLRQDLIRDLLFLWNPQRKELHTLMSVGMDVCGHPSIVHGGFTSGARSGAAGGEGTAGTAGRRILQHSRESFSPDLLPSSPLSMLPLLPPPLFLPWVGVQP